MGTTAAPSARRSRDRNIDGVHLAPTDLGYMAQGLSIELIEDTPPRWATVVPGGHLVEEWALGTLVRTLIAGGHLAAGES
jgi:hypothetical protein